MSAPAGKRAPKAKSDAPAAIVTGDPAPPSDSATPASGTVEIECEEIARIAYSYWEARGCQGGSAEEDWLRAERELRGGK